MSEFKFKRFIITVDSGRSYSGASYERIQFKPEIYGNIVYSDEKIMREIKEAILYAFGRRSEDLNPKKIVVNRQYTAMLIYGIDNDGDIGGDIEGDIDYYRSIVTSEEIISIESDILWKINKSKVIISKNINAYLQITLLSSDRYIVICIKEYVGLYNIQHNYLLDCIIPFLQSANNIVSIRPYTSSDGRLGHKIILQREDMGHFSYSVCRRLGETIIDGLPNYTMMLEAMLSIEDENIEAMDVDIDDKDFDYAYDQLCHPDYYL